MTPPESRLTPAQALELAMDLCSSFQTVIQAADNKLAMLLVVHPGASLLVLSQAGDVAMAPGLTLANAVIVAAALSFTLGFIAAGREIFLAISPRVHAPAGNRFSFPAVAGRGLTNLADADVNDLAAEAWSQAEVLADIARAKNRHVLLAVRWLVPMIAGGAAGLAAGVLR